MLKKAKLKSVRLNKSKNSTLISLLCQKQKDKLQKLQSAGVSQFNSAIIKEYLPQDEKDLIAPLSKTTDCQLFTHIGVGKKIKAYKDKVEQADKDYSNLRHSWENALYPYTTTTKLMEACPEIKKEVLKVYYTEDEVLPALPVPLFADLLKRTKAK